MAEFVNTIDVLGDDALARSIVDGSLTEYCDNILSAVGSYAFYNYSTLTKADCPNAKSVGSNAFYSCTKLAVANFPRVASIGEAAFISCKALTTVNFPLLTSIPLDGFCNCSALTTVDFASLTSIGRSALQTCQKLTTVILRNTAQVATLSNTDAFRYDPLEYGQGNIYVPRALLDSYKSATNWSTLANRFRALEDYTVDGTTTGELDPTKI